MNFRFAYIILAFATLSGCSSMHAPTYKTTLPKNTIQFTNNDTSINLPNSKDNKQAQFANPKKNTSRFKDTNMIDLPVLIASRDPNAIQMNDTQAEHSRQIAIAIFETALQEFDNQKFQECCGKFSSIAETFLPTDSLYFEAKFYECECKIVNNKVIDAKLTLEALYIDHNIPASVMERVIVRLGQIDCLLKNTQEANKYFAELKAKFPNSIYLKVANCNAIHQSTK
ncbi:MAG TPA: hypothetical protein P5545_07795 [Bacteroidota bacterium]|nr:hypothetical protein [Candidatus Kapabacteria bacterium]HRS02435.1 hypothetical protein [Bacteroidota bacterium]